jgi:hypothetical protein
LDAVKISLTEQYTSSNWRRYAFKRQVILLHNGKPIEPLSTIKSFNGFNPFMSQQNKEIQNIMASQISLLKSDAVYKASELKKPGKYEIVFRTPPTNNLIVSGDKEIRFPISFDKFR